MTFTTILAHTHSGVRWLVVAAALAALVFFGYGWLAKKYSAKPARILPAAYSGLLDLQVLIGFIYLFTAGFNRYRLEHMTVLLIAAVVAHLPRKWRDGAVEIYYRNTFFTVLASIILIIVGVSLIGGWS